MGGSFTNIYLSNPIYNIGYWNINNNIMYTFFNNYYYNGLNGTVNNLSLDTSRNLLYIGGSFTASMLGFSSPYITAWDLSINQFKNLNNLHPNNVLNNTVNTLSFDQSNNKLYMGGNFNAINNPLNYVGVYDLSNSTISGMQNYLYNGVDGSVNAISVDISNNLVYIGGGFKNSFSNFRATVSY
jgi:hypothetical protein